MSAPSRWGLELLPDDVLGDELAAGEGAEAAIDRRDDAAAVTDRIDRFADTVGHHLGMLDEVGERIDHAGSSTKRSAACSS